MTFLDCVAVADIGIVLNQEESKIAVQGRGEYAEAGNIFRCPPYLDTRTIDARGVNHHFLSDWSKL